MKTAIFYRQGKRKSAKSALPCDESEVELISLTSIVEKNILWKSMRPETVWLVIFF